MSITTECPHCRKRLKVAGNLVGRNVRCPACHERFLITNVAFGDEQGTSHEAAETRKGGDTSIDPDETPTVGGSAPPARGTGKRFGRFELLAELGRGGFGVVHRAYDPQMKREVALKRAHVGVGDEKRVKRFLGEAHAAANLRHPNIVPVFESGTIDDEVYIAAEYVPGHTLAERIKTDRPSFEESVRIIRDLAEALAYAHGEGIVHRDVKPHNVMLDDRGRPQLMDFGLAKRLDEDSSMTADGAVLGTPHYMAPEQARGELEQVGPHSDQYSLGVVLYELLTGKKPFDGSPHAVINDVATKDPPRPRSVVPAIPRDLEAVCARAMTKEAGHRYAGATEFAADCDRWLAGRNVVARPAPVWRRLGRWARRNPTIATLLAAVVLVTATGFAGVTLALGHATQNAERAQLAEADATRNATTAQQAADRADANAKQAAANAKQAEANAERADANARQASASAQRADREKQAAQDALAEARRELYFGNIVLAGTKWNNADLAGLSELLAACPEEHRDWEWYYLNNAVGSAAAVLADRGAIALDVALDGETVVVAKSGQIVRRSATNGDALWTADFGAMDVALSRDGSLVAAAGRGELRLYDGTDGHLLKSIVLAEGEHARALISHDGRFVFTATSAYESRPEAAAGSPRVVECIKQWSVESGDMVRAIPVTLQSPMVPELALSPDGKTLWVYAIGSPLQRFYVATGKPAGPFPHGGRPLALSPDGRLVAAGSRLYEIETGELLTILGERTRPVLCAAFSPDGARIALGGIDRVVEVYDLESHRRIRRLVGHASPVVALGFIGMSELVSADAGAGDQGTLRRWNVDTTNSSRVIRGDFASVTASSRSALVACGTTDGRVQLWNLETGEQVVEFQAHELSVDSVELAEDDTWLVSGSRSEGSVKLWNLKSRALVRAIETDFESIRQIECGWGIESTLVIGSMDGTSPLHCRLLDLGTGDQGYLDDQRVHRVAIAPRGRHWAVTIKSGTFDYRVGFVDRIEDFNSVSTTEAAPSPGSHRGLINAMEFSVDGESVVSGGQDRTIRIWDRETGRSVGVIRGHAGAVASAVYGPHSGRIYSSASDETTRVWDSHRFREVFRIKGPGTVRGLTTSHDGRFLLGDAPGGLRVWDAGPAYVERFSAQAAGNE